MKIDDFDAAMMRLALEEARAAALKGEAPIGAVLADRHGAVIAKAGNAPIGDTDPTAHAEIRALRAGAKHIGNYRLPDTSLYVTLEPCAMCAGAVAHSRVARLIIAAPDKKGGAVWHGPQFFTQPTCHWRPEITRGPFAEEAGQLLKDFFKERRGR